MARRFSFFSPEEDEPFTAGTAFESFSKGLVGGGLGALERTMAEKAREERRLRIKEEDRIEEATFISDEDRLRKRREQNKALQDLTLKGFVEDTGDLQDVTPESQRIEIFDKTLVKPETASEIAERKFKEVERKFKTGEFERKEEKGKAPVESKALKDYLKVRKDLEGIETLDPEDEALLAHLKSKAFEDIGFVPPDLSPQSSPIDAQNLPVGNGEELTPEIAAQFLAVTGGDKVQAKQIAEANGFLVPEF